MEIEKVYWNWQFVKNVGLEIPFICSSTCATEHGEQRGIHPNLQYGDKQGYLQLGEDEKGKATLYDITGKQLAIYSLKEGNNQLDFSKISISGMVVYEIQVNNKVVTRDKLVFISR